MGNAMDKHNKENTILQFEKNNYSKKGKFSKIALAFWTGKYYNNP